MTDEKLIERLRAVIDTAKSDAYTAASQMNATAEDHAETERDVNEAEAVCDKEAPYGCWEWQGALSLGYGGFSIAGKQWRVHRLSYSLIVEKSRVRRDCPICGKTMLRSGMARHIRRTHDTADQEGQVER